jgi:hypothetical protein
MRTRFDQTLGLAPEPAAAEPIARNGAGPNMKEIPYDHVATFKLTGNPTNRVQDVINTSVDGAFVAVAIGYSFIPAPLPLALNFQGDLGQPVDRRVGTAATFAGTAFAADPRSLVRHVIQCLLVRLCGIDFKYSIIDSAVGRELQNRPIHNIAGLGEVNGNRPFRPMAKPMLFMPRSTIRIEIEEISQGPLYEGAELYLVLHGYKILGYGTG